MPAAASEQEDSHSTLAAKQGAQDFCVMCMHVCMLLNLREGEMRHEIKSAHAQQQANLGYLHGANRSQACVLF